jgi:hypothetical protein
VEHLLATCQRRYPVPRALRPSLTRSPSPQLGGRREERRGRGDEEGRAPIGRLSRPERWYLAISLGLWRERRGVSNRTKSLSSGRGPAGWRRGWGLISSERKTLAMSDCHAKGRPSGTPAHETDRALHTPYPATRTGPAATSLLGWDLDSSEPQSLDDPVGGRLLRPPPLPAGGCGWVWTLSRSVRMATRRISWTLSRRPLSLFNAWRVTAGLADGAVSRKGCASGLGARPTRRQLWARPAASTA